LDIEDLRTERNIQEQLNEALKEENAAAVAYTKTLEDQVRGLKNIVGGLREQRRGLTGELE
jgi:DNA-binding phage protein